MSEHYHASTSLNPQQNPSILEAILAFAFDLVVGDIGEIRRMVDLSGPIPSPERILAHLPRDLAKLSASHLRALRSQVAVPINAARTVAEATALVQFVERAPLLWIGIDRLNSADWRQARKLTTSATQQLREGSLDEAVANGRKASRVVRNAIHNVQNRFAAARHQVVGEAARTSLARLGYRVETVQDTFRAGRWTVHWATRAAESMAVVISPDAGLTVDMMGRDGPECRADLHGFIREMEEQGITMRQERRHFHGRKSGGALLQGATRVARRTHLPLPEAILHTLKQPRQDQSSRVAKWIAMRQLQQEG